MSIKPGKVRITEEIDELNFFKLKQEKIEYYAINLYFSEFREGYLVFSLPSDLDKLFRKTEYNSTVMLDILKTAIEEFQFVSFADEDPNSGIVEFAGSMGKEDVIRIYEN